MSRKLPSLPRFVARRGPVPVAPVDSPAAGDYHPIKRLSCRKQHWTSAFRGVHLMEEGPIAGILGRLASSEADQAWEEFLDLYHPLIIRVIRHFEENSDRLCDCFVFVCERLNRRRFRRLRSFRLDGPASFKTWLQVVVRNLCLDWRRSRLGRSRPSPATASLHPLDQEIYRCVFEGGMKLHEAFEFLRVHVPNLTESRVEAGVERIRQLLSPGKLWALVARRPSLLSLDMTPDAGETARPLQVADPEPDPEDLAILNEKRACLARALMDLAETDRLIVRLRYQEGLTLQVIGDVVGLPGPQAVARKLQSIQERLRDSLTSRDAKTDSRVRV